LPGSDNHHADAFKFEFIGTLLTTKPMATPATTVGHNDAQQPHRTPLSAKTQNRKTRQFRKSMLKKEVLQLFLTSAKKFAGTAVVTRDPRRKFPLF